MSRVAAILLLLALLSTPAAPGPPFEVLPAVSSQDFYLLVPSREIAAIEAELAAAREEGAEADRELARATSAIAQEERNAEIKKREIATIKDRIRAAKKEKNRSERSDWSKQKKIEGTELRLLENRVEMRRAEIAYATARKEAAVMTVAACNLERQRLDRLATLRPNLLGPVDPLEEPEQVEVKLARAVTLDPQIRDLERAVLQARRDAAILEQTAAKRAADLYKRRIEVLESQGSVAAVRS